jgi:hypothetical protein
MVLAVWRYSTTENGEQSVIILGVLMMPESHVVSSDIDMLSEHFQQARFLQVPGGYGWIMSHVQEVNKI